MSTSKTTTDLKVIKKWAEERNGKPSRVKNTNAKDGEGIIRINFPGYSGEDSLEDISWDEWFKIFTEGNLAFLYQDTTGNGKESRFFKLIDNQQE